MSNEETVEKSKSKKAPTLTSVTVPFNRILADDTTNNRGEIDPDSDDMVALRKSISDEGLLEPLVGKTIKGSSLTDDERTILGLEKDDAVADWYFKLISGFRRFYAICKIREEEPGAFKDVPVTAPSSGNKTDDFFRNLAENMQRKNLTPGELADAFYRAKEILGLTAKDIAGRVPGITSGYITTLIALRKGLSGEAWKAFHAGEIGFDVARKIKDAGEEKEQNAALAEYRKAVEGQEGKKRKRGGKAAVAKKNKGDKDTGNAKRPSVKDMRTKLEELSGEEKLTVFQQGVVAGLAFAVGDKKRLPTAPK